MAGRLMQAGSAILDEMFSLEGKIALVTGSAGGIGQTFSVGLARAGATLALCDIRKEALDPVIASIEDEGGSANAFFVDLARRQSIHALRDAILAAFGRVDILVNCAAINKCERSSMSRKAPMIASWRSICAASTKSRRRSCR